MPIIQRATFTLPIVLACAAPMAANAQTAYLQSSGIVGEGKTLSISRLPVADANGNLTYDDVTIAFSVSATGSLSQAGKAKIVPSAVLVTNGFIAGRYYVKAGSCATQFADVTYGTGSGGSTVWNLVLETNANCGGAYPNQATWQTGAPAPDVAARLAAAKVPDNPNYSYGLTEIGGGANGPFYVSNGLLAAEQVSNELTLISYTTYHGDQSGQAGSIIFGLCADSTCSNAPA